MSGLAGWRAAVCGAALLLVPGALGTPTGATFSDSAVIASATIASGAFVPAPASPLSCATTPATLTSLSRIEFSTPAVAAPPRGSVEYVLRVVRTDVSPDEVVKETVVRPAEGSPASFTYDVQGLTLFSIARYQARVTTRLLGQSRESAPAQVSRFTISGLAVPSFTCA